MAVEEEGDLEMTSEEVNRLAGSEPGASAVLIGGEDEREAYYPAIVAFDDVTGRFVYDYGRLVEAFAKSFSDGITDDPETEAAEWIDFNASGRCRTPATRRRSSCSGMRTTARSATCSPTRSLSMTGC